MIGSLSLLQSNQLVKANLNCSLSAINPGLEINTNKNVCVCVYV